jgi:hypothetical protein
MPGDAAMINSTEPLGADQPVRFQLPGRVPLEPGLRRARASRTPGLTLVNGRVALRQGRMLP